MGPYRTNSAPLRARRQELRLELEDLDAKMTELSLARDVVERAIEDIDVRLQAGFRPPRRLRSRARVLPIVVATISAVAVFLAIGVAAQRPMQPRCIVAIDSPDLLQKAGYTPIQDRAEKRSASLDGGTGP